MMRILRDIRGATALEFALTFPVALLFILGTVAAYGLISARRAMDVGLEKALRYAVVHSGSSQGTVNGIFSSAASPIWGDVAGVTPTYNLASWAVGDTLTITVTYNWAPIAANNPAYQSTIFNSATLTGTASMRVIN